MHKDNPNKEKWNNQLNCIKLVQGLNSNSLNMNKVLILNNSLINNKENKKIYTHNRMINSIKVCKKKDRIMVMVWNSSMRNSDWNTYCLFNANHNMN